ncbi:molybdenum cofactor cytidylyltransferase [Modicisalibacter muralis]|uniref:Molybdenum cofactor cytidylyltransferase n=1 Tax=Modicisalibacter muralis TaxID=119000 RepID=A0A1G9JWB2_9GAMM|nr:nucleotidyltransferase family protein [Halomonas muralis]SDL41642.1 molybdenum cofactor cytidylyltransferase [Halomonas muralis]
MPCESVVALVLAAGRARRFGSDKRRTCLPSRGPLLAATLETLRPHFTDIRVVLRHDDDRRLLGIPADIATIPAIEAEQGMGASLAAGLRALSRDSHAEAVAVMHGDMPWVQGAIFRALCAQAHAGLIVRPVFQGQGGHPVVFGRQFWPRLCCLEGDTGARGVVRDHRAACIEIETLDSGVLRDIDRPEDMPR